MACVSGPSIRGVGQEDLNFLYLLFVVAAPGGGGGGGTPINFG